MIDPGILQEYTSDGAWREGVDIRDAISLPYPIPSRSSSKGAPVIWSALSGEMIHAIWQTRNNHSFRSIPASMPSILGCNSRMG
jgi:hypothetical protein